MTRTTCLVVVLLMLIAQIAGAQATLHVPATYPTIQAGIDNAVTGDTVLVEPGTYFENLIIQGKEITLRGANGPDVTIVDGNQAGPVLFIKPGLGPELLIEGLTFRNGRGADGFGFGVEGQAGGIYIHMSGPTIKNCHIINNKGGDVGDQALGGAGGIGAMGTGLGPDGVIIIKCVVANNVGGTTVALPGMGMNGQGGTGGVHICEGNMFMRATLVMNNQGGESWYSTGVVGAGGIEFAMPRGPNIIRDSEICFNTAGLACDGTPQAGAGGIHGGSPLIEFCVVDDNQGGDVAGQVGVYASGAGGIFGDAPKIMNTYVRNNKAGDAGAEGLRGAGGGIHVLGNAFIGSSVVTGNLGGSDLFGPGVGGAGGIHALGGDVMVIHCTLAKNQGGGAQNLCGCGGIHNEGGLLCIENSILWNDAGGLGPTPAVNEVGGLATIAVAFTNIKGNYAGVANMDSDPLFVDEAGDDFHLTAFSPCLDAANCLYPNPPHKDIDAEPRFIGNEVDMGADELNKGIFPGPGEDLVLESLIHPLDDPLASAKYVTVGDQLDARVISPLHTYAPATFWLLSSPFPTGSPPMPIPGYPGFQLDPLGLIVLAPGPYPFYETSWSNGRRWVFNIYSSFPGWSLMIQGFALDSTAANGWFAATEGHELRFD